MSLCYDFQKWIMITLSIVAISVTLGLVVLLSMQVVYGYIDPEEYWDFPALYNKLPRYNAVESLLDYCYLHASDSLNPVQDLIDKGLLSQESQELIFSGWLPKTDCETVKIIFDSLDYDVAVLLSKHYDDTHNITKYQIPD